MKIVSSSDGGRCDVQDIPMVCPDPCYGQKFTLVEGEDWIGHDKQELFFVAVCDKCEKLIDISIEMG
jgi:hypothetical protein